MSLRVFADGEAVSHGAAEFFVHRARKAIEDQGVFRVALAGGSTPKRLYQLLAEEPYRDFVEWHKVLVFFGDERIVPATDPNSNEGMAREALLSQVPIPPENVFPMYLPGDVAEAAHAYEGILKGETGGTGVLDLVLLGIGDDGHTASLFPGIPELAETEKLVVPTLSPKGVAQRLTLTIPALQMAHTLLFLVVGADKNGPLTRALGTDDATRPPSGVVAKGANRAVWYADEAAAAGLEAV